MDHHALKYFSGIVEIIELKNAFASVKVAVNIGNTLFSLEQKGDEIIYFPFSLEEYRVNSKLAGNPFMHPWANRLEGDHIKVEGHVHSFSGLHKDILYRDGNDLPLHGLLLKSDKWETTALQEDEYFCSHTAELIFDDKKWLSIFPYRHKVIIKHLLKDNELKIETTIVNLDEREMPVSFGFHPYFIKKNETTKLTVPVKDTIEVNDIMIPTGKLFPKENKWNFISDTISLKDNSFDDGFQNLKWNENDQTVFSLDELKVVLGANYPFVQIYAPANPDKPYVCIEPMTAATNALNSGTCKSLKKQETFTADFSIVV